MNPNNVVVPKIRLSEPNLDQHEIANITTAISENNLTFGIYQKLFSEKLTDYLGVSNVILTNSGTSSLHMLYKYVGISKDNLVIIPDITFAGTVFPVIYLGANPTFIDVSTDDYNINLEVLESFLSNKRKKFKGKIWLIAVDIFGFPNRYADLLSLSSKYDVKLILDAAESLGSKFNGKVPGNYIDNLATSFNGNKIITSSGGGAIGCNDAKMFEKISYWINQSKSALESYHHEEIGYNYRLSNVHAAIGYAQILKIDEFIEKRRMIRNFYNTFFKENNLGITVLMDSNEQTSNAWLTVIKFTGENCENTRDKVKNTLDAAGIETRLIWKPMSCQPVFKKYESITNQFSIKAFHQSLCLPSHPGLSINDLELVVTKIEESLKL